jgi:hypothetical protein
MLVLPQGPDNKEEREMTISQPSPFHLVEPLKYYIPFVLYQTHIATSVSQAIAKVLTVLIGAAVDVLSHGH